VPLVYVVRHRIIPDFDNKDLPMVYQDSRFTTYDKEMEARAPIIDMEEWDEFTEGETLHHLLPQQHEESMVRVAFPLVHVTGLGTRKDT
jgi:hypothetical protein